jgi:hypothetical protein
MAMITMVVPAHLTGERAAAIAATHPAMFTYRIERDTAEKLAAMLRKSITADMIIEQLGLDELNRSRLGAFIVDLLTDRT